MSLNGIDISDYQRGINLAAVPADFVIVKVSQNTGYVSPDWRRQAAQTLATGKLLGLYHYIGGADPTAEVNNFLSQARPYIGRAALFLDWESMQNSRWGDTAYLESFVNTFVRMTGVRPLVYTPHRVYAQLRPLLARLNCGMWLQTYASTDDVNGYQAHPWAEGQYACAIRQYASTGILPGYGAHLDMDKFYGDRAAWMKYASVNGHVQPAPSAPTRKSVAQLASEVLNKQWGDGADRKNRLTAAGYDYAAVQAEVNRRLGVTTKASIADVAHQIVYGPNRWGNEPQRSQNLRAAGYDPAAVQNAVNRLMGHGGGSGQRSQVVRSSDTLSGITGIKDWAKLCQIAKENGIADPNRIYPGQTIRW